MDSRLLTISVWREGDSYGVSVNGDNPTRFEPPWHFLKPYLKDKRLKEGHIIPFGEALYRSVFTTQNRRDQIKGLLRGPEKKRVTIQIQSGLGEIHDIPWEIIKDPESDRPWVLSGNVAICRGVPSSFIPPNPLPLPLKVLLVISLPLEVYEEAPLDPLREVEIINRATEQWRDVIEIDTLVRATWSGIRERLQKGKYHVLHFTGHGGPGGSLLLEDERDYQRARPISLEDTRSLLEGVGLRVVILNACHTATSTPISPSAAMAVHDAGVPLVVAHQAPVRDDEATRAMEGLYSALLSEKETVHLLDFSRLKLEEWWKPVVFAHPSLRGSQLFDLKTKPEPRVMPSLFRDLGTFGNAELYIYRYAPLRQITQHFLQGARLITLHGLGGVGKSFMADYLARFLRPRFRHVLAVDLREELTEPSFEELKGFVVDTFQMEGIIPEEKALELKAPSGPRSFWQRLNDALGRVPWLLVLDNFEVFQERLGKLKEPAMREFLKVIQNSPWGGLALITTRLVPYLSDRMELKPVVEMGSYSEGEQILFFLGLINKDQELAQKVYARRGDLDNILGWHPLALDLLLRHPEEEPARIARYEDIQKVMDFYRPYLKEYPGEFGLFFMLKYPFSKELLEILIDNPAFEDLVIRKLRLAERVGDGLFRIYPLVPRALGVEPPHPESLGNLLDKLLKFEAKGAGDGLNIVELTAWVGELTGDQRDKLAQKYNKLGLFYHAKGDLDKAIEYHEKALEIWKGLYGERHPDVATSYNNIATVYHAKGDLDRAIEYLEKALEIRKERYGEGHSDVATSYNNIAMVYHAKGDLDKAIEYHEKALEIRKERYGERHSDVAQSYNNMAGVYHAKGDLDRAIEYHEKALEIRKGLYGERHPDVAQSYNNIATVYHDKGDLDKAIEYHEKALEIWKGLYGEGHPAVATSYNNIATVYRDKGGLDKTIDYHEKALEIFKGLYGERHPDVATSYNNMAGVYHDKGDLDKAIEYLEKALEIVKKLEHWWDLVDTSVSLGNIYLRKGNRDGAYHCLKEALDALDVLIADGHPGVLGFLGKVAYLWAMCKVKFGEDPGLTEQLKGLCKRLNVPPEILIKVEMLVAKELASPEGPSPGDL